MLTVLALLVVVTVVVASTVSWWTHRQVRVAGDPACPARLTGTSSATQDFADLLVWQGRTYVHVEQGPDVTGGDEVGRITCSVGDIDNPEGLGLESLPWPDGTATTLPRGTVLRAAGRDALLAYPPGEARLYCLGDAGTVDPPCGVRSR